MKIKLLQLIIMTLKFFTYGALFQVICLGVLIAHDSDAQYKRASETYVDVDIHEKSIDEVIHLIEENTDFNFYFLKNDFDKSKKITISSDRALSVSEILLEISKICNVKFRQVNNNISISSISKSELKKGVNRFEIEVADIEVTGTIRDQNSGEPLPGVNIVIKGTSVGTVTDINGYYSIAVPDENTVLVFSSVGYVSEEVTVGEKTVIDLQLVADITALDEIVVVGYGTQEKKEITSSIVSVQEDEFNKGNVNDPNQLLQGRVAGLQIAKVGGNPNQPYTVRLRGLNTFGANDAPLVVIDGILGGDLSTLDPNDIASVEVLKDASAAAIYGTRGSAGVLIFTTKSGQKGADGKPLVNYNGYVAFEQIANQIEIASADKFLELGGRDFGAKTDWLDEVTHTGISNVHNISFSNNANGMNYRVAINYRDVKSVVKDANEYDQFNIRLNISQRLLNDRLKVGASGALTTRKSNIGYQQTLAYALTFNPTAPIFENRSEAELGGRDPNQFGGYFETDVQDRFNPVAINALNTHKENLNKLLGNVSVDYEVIDNLVLAGTYTLQTGSTDGGEYSASTALFGSGGDGLGGTATRDSYDDTNHQFDGTITYYGDKDNLNYNIVGGYSYNYFTYESFFANNTDFITDNFLYNNLNAGRGLTTEGGTRDMGSTKEESKLAAFFGRVNLNLNDSYFLSGSYRREGSSKFGANNRWGNFWAVSGGADFSNIFDLSYFQALKLRVGYGINGNLPNEYYAYLTTLGTTSGGYANGEFIPAVAPQTNPNPDLKWEEKAELNVGLDFTFLNSRFSGSLDYFTRDTRDLINTVGVPSPPNQVNTTLMNVGEVETNGVEVQLNFDAIKNDNFSWSVSGNLASAKTKLVKWNANEEVVELFGGNLGAPGLNGTLVVRTAEGEEIGQLLAQPFVRYENGVAVMLNKDGSETTQIDRNEFRVVGHALPDFTAGLTNTFSYKDFDLSIFFRGVFGHSLANVNRAYHEHQSIIGRGNIVMTDGFTLDDTQSEAWHSNYVEDASFVKLDNLLLGYNFSLPGGSAFRSIRVYVSGQNLLTITGYSGADPEVRYYDAGPITEGNRNQSFSGNSLFPGVDRRVTYPPTRTYTVGLNIGL